MTREEAQTFHYNSMPVDGVINQFDVSMKINEIYDDFESRICENCEHYFENGKQCLNEESIAFTSQEAIYYDDGCNKFKRKDKS